MPDFRAGERLFSLLTQVAGRSGRGAERGKVLIQTFNPDHYSIIAARRHDYRQFHGLESEARRELGYPPFSRLVRLVFESGSAERSLAAAARAAGVLSRCGGGDLSVLGPAPAILGRLKGAHRSQVLIKGGASLAKAKAAIGGMLDFKSGSHPFPGVRVVVDVDPVAML
jgi:primosomal protein N' (replication factor Y)